MKILARGLKRPARHHPSLSAITAHVWANESDDDQRGIESTALMVSACSRQIPVKPIPFTAGTAANVLCGITQITVVFRAGEEHGLNRVEMPLSTVGGTTGYKRIPAVVHLDGEPGDGQRRERRARSF